MAPAVVYLHIGSPKTGTTYLQDSLWDNRDALADAGVLLPGRTRTITGKSVGELMSWRTSDPVVPVGWRRLAREINSSDATSVVLSHEHLHKASSAQWRVIVESIEATRLEIVLTARDLARSVPAQWQSSVRQRYTWTLSEYADSIAASKPGPQQQEGPAKHFWRRQDSPAILRRYLGRVGQDRVRLVTVPPSGGDPDELWRRFCQACDIDVTRTTPGSVSHESLGAASAELMRRLNGNETVEGLGVAEYKKAVNHVLSRHALSPRRSAEPGLVLPERHRAWAEREAGRMIDSIEATGVQVIGDLHDLQPRPSSRPFVAPEELPDGQLLAAALDGLAGMAVQHLELRAVLEEATRAAASQAPTSEPRAAALDAVRRRLRRDS